MAIINDLKGLFSSKKGLHDLSVDDLNRERIRLTQTEREFVKKIDGIEAQKREMFMSGKDEKSERQQLIIARKIKELDVQAKNYDKSLSVISQQQRTINGFIQLKENEKLLAQSGLSKLLNTVDLGTLQTYVQQASVDGEFKMDKLKEVLGVVEGSDTMPVTAREEEDIMSIVREMQRASEMESDPSAIESAMANVNKTLSAADKETN